MTLNIPHNERNLCSNSFFDTCGSDRRSIKDNQQDIEKLLVCMDGLRNEDGRCCCTSFSHSIGDGCEDR
jgi:hypothetical protein